MKGITFGVVGLSLASALAVACNRDSSAAGTTTTTQAAVTTTSTAVAAAKEKDVDLAPLPLKAKLPADETAMAMDMSLGEIKSVSVSYDAVSAGFNVSVPIEKSFAETKKSVKGDTVLFPFKRWVSETDTTAVEEFNNEGKSGFIAYAWKTVGGKPYLCKSNGLSGLKSADDANKVLKVCDTLAAK